MGEAVYYMRARFKDAETAIAVEPVVRTFLERMAEAENAWQNSRSGGVEADQALRAKYLDVFEMLGISQMPESDAQSRNYLAGILDSPANDPSWDLQVSSDEIQFFGEVWHFADWAGLARALGKMGAIQTGWISEEYAETDYFAMITLQ